ncbi:MAG: hypothetical protein ABSB74_08570 [Tepidisphaeraceae bacterium]
MLEWMRSANSYGVWGFLSTLILFISYFTALKVLVLPKRRVPHLNFIFERKRDNNYDWPLRIMVKIRNFTGQPCVITSPYATLVKLRPDSRADRDSPSGQLEVKFDPREGEMLTEIDTLIRHRGEVHTWIPLDPAQRDEEVDAALSEATAGVFECKCVWVGERLRRHSLRVKIQRHPPSGK